MSAMTGPKSPTSPWPQESPSLQLANASPPTALFSLCDSQTTSLNPNVNSQQMTPDCSGPSYFSLSADHSNHPRKSKDSLTRNQSSVPSPKSHLISQRNAFENYMDQTGSGIGLGGRRDSPVYKLSVSRASEVKKPGPGPSNGSMALGVLGSSHPIPPERCAELLAATGNNIMLLDVRPYTHFTKGHIKSSLNLCIPTTLLKRPSFNTQKLANTFTNDADRTKFAHWRNCDFIIVYDAATTDMKDAVPLANLLRKFAVEGWTGKGLVLCGGFSAFSRQFPDLVQQQLAPEIGSCSPTSMSTQSSLPVTAPIAGGCAMPDATHPSIPFFENIRQHMGLLGGVGQIPLQLPAAFTQSMKYNLPLWLQKAADGADQGLNVSEKFLDLEKNELERMKQALSYDKSANPTISDSTAKFRVAGIEKGTKNRYKDIYPFDHSRVRMHDVSPDGCDYVNANFIQAEYSDKIYIATQAPVPDTFTDFWRVVWEQDIRLVVSLTAEVERGQVKCHPYWVSGDYGPFRVNNYSQKYIYMDSPQMGQVDFGPSEISPETNEDFKRPCIIVRHFGLSHSAFPFQPLREVMQLQYPYWPDFGTTSQPAHLVQLIEECNKIRDATTNASGGPCAVERTGQRPVLVHCSAGCGRTGTFCTVDSVIDMVRRQWIDHTRHSDSLSTAGRVSCKEWMHDEDLDLIAKTVSDFRMQRPSMVQNLSQFVLCYESLLEWLTSKMVDENRSDR